MTSLEIQLLGDSGTGRSGLICRGGHEEVRGRFGLKGPGAFEAYPACTPLAWHPAARTSASVFDQRGQLMDIGGRVIQLGVAMMT